MSSLSNHIWQQHSKKLELFICSKIKGESECYDILHDPFLKITENEERIKLALKPASYVIKMAQNAIIDHYRSQKKIKSVLLSEEISYTASVAEIQLADCCLLTFIKNLPSNYCEALILTELEGLSQKQLAKKLNISYTGAKSRVQRGKKMLKEAILACCPYQFDRYGNIIGCC